MNTFYRAELWGRERKFLRKKLSVDYGEKSKTEEVSYLGSHTLELCGNLPCCCFFRCKTGSIYLFHRWLKEINENENETNFKVYCKKWVLSLF